MLKPQKLEKDPLEVLKELAEKAKKDPEFNKRLGQAFARPRTAGTSREKAWD